MELYGFCMLLFFLGHVFDSQLHGQNNVLFQTTYQA